MSRQTWYWLLVLRDVVAFILALNVGVAVFALIGELAETDTCACAIRAQGFLTVLLSDLPSCPIWSLAYGADKQEGKLRGMFPASVQDSAVYYLSGCVLFLAFVGFSAIVSACVAAVCCSSGHGCTFCFVYDPFYCWYGPTNSDCCCCSSTSHHHTTTTSNNCGNGCGNDCGNCKGDCKGDAALILIVAFAVIGLFVLLFLLFQLVNGALQRHLHILEKRLDCLEQRVVDLQNRNVDEVLAARTTNWTVATQPSSENAPLITSMEPSAPPLPKTL